MVPQWLKHAFAVDDPQTLTLSDRQERIVERICREVVRRHLATPALMALEMARPLNFVGAQVMHFFHPFVSVVTDANGYREFTALLERRGAIDVLVERLEALDSENAMLVSTRNPSLMEAQARTAAADEPT